ncbi:hypothetical protein CULCOIPH002_01320 [Corynebacterium ulcerans]|uniref:Uncharacterized protein n=1 Tax=Corynebacterium ulcerans TaxID=65058 RepID=A0ABD0BJF5_CORUL|nr:hypothetical protein CULCOIPH001_14750 [Corynebacterium ulcerans]GJJ35220.1 hypothetical protein CULCOIPH002_01320 [Corynebacterium ulcerans]GJJ38345.1 hypothetical protein CULCOIPH003_09760 [Corynebacterium ulcerans]GJJ41349.1 hypothetical protein CULCOIPH004_17600 [Corynebacterium ulcerans]GJJ42731.1 hypothetical protein CULCOIPH005_09200 [Corynebacterium ulcerans]
MCGGSPTLPIPVALPVKADGVNPVCLLKARVNDDVALNPTKFATTEIVKS